jgi:hypothetical protein
MCVTVGCSCPCACDALVPACFHVSVCENSVAFPHYCVLGGTVALTWRAGSCRRLEAMMHHSQVSDVDRAACVS